VAPTDVHLPSVAELDRLSSDDFVISVAPLFEGAPAFLGRLAAARPFGSAEVLFDRAGQIALAMPEREQIELLDAHPRLGAPPGGVSSSSFREQGYDRDARAEADDELERERARVAAELERLNADYETRFGFRYCVFVAGRPRGALLPDFAAALDARRADELARGLRAVVEIARDRFARSATIGRGVT
jgi:2-oxo-4-hydroxy-4-carboxy--5-ureidoimidazoline (OHCU) decarboxylase